MSRGLGQTELIDVAPPRKLIVRDGHCAWFGVDPSTVRVSLATIDAEGRRGVSTVAFPGLAGAHRLDAIYGLTRTLVAETAGLLRPGVVAVEQPSAPKSRGVNPWLYQAVGVIMAAVVAGVGDVDGYPVEVVDVVASQWKALAVGRGNIAKPKKIVGMPAPRPEEYPVLVWARDLGYVGTSWDEADAFGVAEWARRTFALEER